MFRALFLLVGVVGCAARAPAPPPAAAPHACPAGVTSLERITVEVRDGLALPRGARDEPDIHVLGQPDLNDDGVLDLIVDDPACNEAGECVFVVLVGCGDGVYAHASHPEWALAAPKVGELVDGWRELVIQTSTPAGDAPVTLRFQEGRYRARTD